MEHRVKEFVRGLNGIVHQHTKNESLHWEIDYQETPKYYKVLFRGFHFYYLIHSYVVGFVDKRNGNFLQSKTASKPDTKVLTNVNLLECGMEKVTYDGDRIEFLGINF